MKIMYILLKLSITECFPSKIPLKDEKNKFIFRSNIDIPYASWIHLLLKYFIVNCEVGKNQKQEASKSQSTITIEFKNI